MQKDDSKKTFSQLKALGLVWDLLLGIAIPTVSFALLGRFLDQRWHTSPWLTMIGLALALVVTMVIVTRKGREIQKDL